MKNILLWLTTYLLGIVPTGLGFIYGAYVHASIWSFFVGGLAGLIVGVFLVWLFIRILDKAESEVPQ